MLKAKTLCVVEDMDTPETFFLTLKELKSSSEPSIDELQKNGGIERLVGKKQNIVIESYGENSDVEDWLTSLAVLLVKHDSLLKGFIKKLRAHYTNGQAAFSFSIAAWSEAEQKIICDVFEKELCGIVDSIMIDHDRNIISGNLVWSSEAMNFLNGQYMEIGVFKLLKEVLEELEKRSKKPYKLYRNVVVATSNGQTKNEFDIVIECGEIFYVIEVKSGKNFKAWGSLLNLGKEYDIVPDRLLLVDSYLSDTQAKRIEKFCKYYVSNLQGCNFKEKVTQMVCND